MRKVLAGLVVIGVLGVSGAAFANCDFQLEIGSQRLEMVAKSQNKELRGQPPAMPSGDKRPPMMSGDRRPPEPPDGKKPPMSGDKKPPMPPKGDKKPSEKPKDQ